VGKEINKNSSSPFIENLDTLPFPARHLIPMDNYFDEQSAPGPSNSRFTSIQTSRGCPLKCSFCASAVFWKNTWRARTAKNVVDEIEECVEEYNIKEFFFTDDNLTLNRKRTVEICNEIINRGLKIKWSASTGVRPENLDYELLKMMKKSGCHHFSIAPESGSQRLLKEVFNKYMNLDQVLEVVNNCNKVDIRTTGLIIIGAIGETEEDKMLTKKYVRKLAKNGLDELGVFPLVPYPETPIAEKYKHIKEISNWEELSTGVIPEWYPNFENVRRFKKELYFNHMLFQVIYHPSKIIRLIRNFVIKRQDIKADRVLKNFVKTFIRKFTNNFKFPTKIAIRNLT